MNLVSCSVVENREVTAGNFLLTLKVPRGFTRPQPGQFVHLRVSLESEPLLRRPYSLEGFVERGKIRAVRIYYSVVGRGSKALASQPKGQKLDLIGPLGVGFSPRPRRTPILVAGGRGVAPLLFLSRKLRERKRPFIFLFGARTNRELYGAREVRGGRLHLATDDGSTGYRGSVLTLLKREWEAGGHTPLTAEIFTCGPHGLLHEVAEFAGGRGVRCEASLEGPMACAVGACRGCPVPLTPGAPGNGARYPAMCLEGPVMDATLVDWERLP
ncbi:MAG: dihydroorotate dehydrogenase electron transfer subunit [Candidatus Eisenbacteria bacterium]|uniref:Dihydroorotate dehydrogenase electron transfer subunit n=1 Tax=Eiseniibacteriota bacterium TaxID=2212470 RepID=A0A538T5W9_UNCEI|nr:MAG: dihydroorotate dehydrogenase electron transfer subunit [Candidatus Eisenbacteria bacterium]